MKKLGVIFVVVAFLVTVVNMAFMFKDAFFYDIEDLPEGEFLYSSLSPSGDKTLKIYKVNSTLGTGVRGELVTMLNSGEMQSQNIFWHTDTTNAVAGWVNDTTVRINNVEINTAKSETFDSRHMLEK